MNDPRFVFEEATRVASKASVEIQGLTGKGKSGLALTMARVLAGSWEDVSAVDTENKSLNLFAGIPSDLGEPFGKFKIGNLTKELGFKPEYYLEFRKRAIAAGAKVFIEDSISHAWQYSGGVLEMVSEAAAKSTNKNDKYAAWRDPDVQKAKNNLLELIRDPNIHVISTVRVKERFEYGDGDDGKQKLQSIGEQQIQQPELKYEPDLVLNMIRAGSNKGGTIVHPIAEVIKSRYAIFTEGERYEFTPEILQQLKEYLEEGVDPEVLLEQQRQDYVNGITEFLNANPSSKVIWTAIKRDAGLEKIKLSAFTLDQARTMFIKITTD
jgi:hypothetical protein